MNIQLGTCTDEKNKLSKSFTVSESITGTLKQQSSITSPEIIIECSNPSAYNYMYIDEFGRYYYITDIVNLRNNLWKISAKVDVLNTYKNQIGNIPIILSNTETDYADSYMNSDIWKTTVKYKTDIINFPSGLNNTGEYILITSGGI